MPFWPWDPCCYVADQDTLGSTSAVACSLVSSDHPYHHPSAVDVVVAVEACLVCRLTCADHIAVVCCTSAVAAVVVAGP